MKKYLLILGSLFLFIFGYFWFANQKETPKAAAPIEERINPVWLNGCQYILFQCGPVKPDQTIDRSAPNYVASLTHMGNCSNKIHQIWGEPMDIHNPSNMAKLAIPPK